MTEEVDADLCITRALRYVETTLDDRERRIIRMRYGLGGKPPLAQREVAAALGISRSYVSRLEKSALEKLHRAMSE